jgi:hypothetical protein
MVLNLFWWFTAPLKIPRVIRWTPPQKQQHAHVHARAHTHTHTQSVLYTLGTADAQRGPLAGSKAGFLGRPCSAGLQSPLGFSRICPPEPLLKPGMFWPSRLCSL